MLLDNTRQIFGSSTVKVDRVSDRFMFYNNFRDLKNERYIFCYCILDYDDNLIFDLNAHMCHLSSFL